MNHLTIQLQVRMAWWWRWYMAGVQFAAIITGLQPDLDKVVAVAHSAARIRIDGGPWQRLR